MASEFVKRTTRYAACEMREITVGRFDLFERHPSARKIFLDPAGRVLDSAGFIQVVERAENDAQDLVFLLGGHDGLPPPWKPKADLLLSLSAMTFPHELARAMLARADLSRLRPRCAAIPTRAEFAHSFSCLSTNSIKRLSDPAIQSHGRSRTFETQCN